MWRTDCPLESSGFSSTSSFLVCGTPEPESYMLYVGHFAAASRHHTGSTTSRTCCINYSQAAFSNMQLSRVRSVLLDCIQMMLGGPLRELRLALVRTLTSFNIFPRINLAFFHMLPNNCIGTHWAEQFGVKGPTRVGFWQSWNLNSVSIVTSELRLFPEFHYRNSKNGALLWIWRSACM